MKVNEKVISYISSFQIHFKKVPYPTHKILKPFRSNNVNSL